MPSHTGDLFADHLLPPEPASAQARSARPRSSTRKGGASPQSPPSPASSPASSAATGSPAWALTAHCDGGARGNPGPAGYGAEVRNADGMVVAELSEFLGIATNNVAEYSGLLACLQYALEQGARSLSVVSDSELMVKQIQGRYKVNSPDLKPLWAEARRRIAKLDRFEIAHALRHKNKAADRLANEAMDRGTKRPHAPGTPAPPPLRATPYPQRAETPAPPARVDSLSPRSTTPAPVPIVRGDSRSRKPALNATPSNSPGGSEPIMLRGFTRDGVIHLLGGHTLPEGRFVKVIPE